MTENLKLPLDNIEVMDNELMFVLGGAGCGCAGGAGCGCGCSCSTPPNPDTGN